MHAPLRLLTGAIPADPALDTAASAAVLAGVAAGAPPAFRLARPGAMVSFGRIDALSPGFPAAVAAARAHGFAAVHRVGGGRAAVFHEDTILFGHAAPVDGTSAADRFCAMGRLLRAALARLGLVAQIGELAGEYCPGSHSLHASGIKLAGIAQRVTGAVAWTEGVVVVGGGGRVRAVLEPVYAALGVEWAPSTAGALDDLLPGVRWEEAAAAVRAELAARFAVVDEPALPRAAAAARRARHDAAGASPAPGAAGERAKVAIG